MSSNKSFKNYIFNSIISWEKTVVLLNLIDVHKLKLATNYKSCEKENTNHLFANILDHISYCYNISYIFIIVVNLKQQL